MKMKPKPETTQQTPPPTHSPVDIEERLKQARSNLEKAFKEYHTLLGNKVLTNNKSEAARQSEKYIVDKLVKQCVELDQINMSEGTLAAVIISLRELLKARDRINELEYDLELLKRDFKKTKKEEK